MAGAMRKIGVYLGLLGDHEDYDMLDDYAEYAELEPDPEPVQAVLAPSVHPRTGMVVRQPGEDMTQDPAFTAKRKVMVIYGHDYEANRALFSWLRAIGLEPLEWGQLVQLSGNASPYIGQVLEQAFKNTQAVLAFFTPDEHVTGRGASLTDKNAWRLQARPNVLIEAGMALVTHPQRTVLVVLGGQELPSDLAGRHYIRLNSTSGPLHELANRLADAGCDVNRTGTQWLDPTNFPNRDNLSISPSQRANSSARPKKVI
jgi:predicted nucleotide-binding protein